MLGFLQFRARRSREWSLLSLAVQDSASRGGTFFRTILFVLLFFAQGGWGVVGPVGLGAVDLRQKLIV